MSVAPHTHNTHTHTVVYVTPPPPPPPPPPSYTTPKASRALDYVLTLDDVDTTSVSVTGHSRNGKQAMLAAAFDHRITSVVSSSSGSPGMTPYRLTGANTFAEGPGDAPHEWWTPSVACFKGCESCCLCNARV